MKDNYLGPLYKNIHPFIKAQFWSKPKIAITTRFSWEPRFNKAELIELLKKEYERLNKPLQRMNMMNLIKGVEIELSRNMEFQVMNMSHLIGLLD